MKYLRGRSLVSIALVLALPGVVHAKKPAEQQASTAAPSEQADKEEAKRIKDLMAALHPVDGHVAIPEAEAELNLGKDYYFLPANEAKRVLTEAWGNPPDSVANVLGIVFPAKKTFIDSEWGAVITWNQVGYISDEDADSIDYNAFIKSANEAEPQLNAQRQAQGFPTQHLVGWAQPPSYDKNRHTLIWAREINVGGMPVNTLNYDMRLLGRKGVLSLNMVAQMPDLPQVRAAASAFTNAAGFTTGARYADFDPATDAKSDLGLGGLVAAGVGVAAAKKFGILAMLLIFLKKFWVLILAGFGGGFAWLRNKFGRKDAEEQV